MPKLKENQVDALDKTMEWFETTNQPEAFHAQATGSGKSVIMGAVARKLGVKTLVLVHRVDLVNQLQGNMSQGGLWTSNGSVLNPVLKVGRMQGSSTQFSSQDDVVIACVDTLNEPRRMDELLAQFTPELIMVDEAHHRFSPDNRQYDLIGLLMRQKPNIKLLNLTATNYKDDPRHPFPMGVKLTEYHIRDLIKLGILHDINYATLPPRTGISDIVATVKAIPNLKKFHTSMYLPNATMAQAILPQLGPDLNFLSYTSEIDADVTKAEAFFRSKPALGSYAKWASVAKAAIGSGDTGKSNVHLQILKALLYLDKNSGGIDGITSYDKATEGLDIPILDCALNFRPLEGALDKVIQISGRTTRLQSMDAISSTMLEALHLPINSSKQPVSVVLDYGGEFKDDCGLDLPTKRTSLGSLVLEGNDKQLVDIILGSFIRDGKPMTRADWKVLFPSGNLKELHSEQLQSELLACANEPTNAHAYTKIYRAGFNLVHLTPEMQHEHKRLASRSMEAYDQLSQDSSQKKVFEAVTSKAPNTLEYCDTHKYNGTTLYRIRSADVTVAQFTMKSQLPSYSSSKMCWAPTDNSNMLTQLSGHLGLKRKVLELWGLNPVNFALAVVPQLQHASLQPHLLKATAVTPSITGP